MEKNQIFRRNQLAYSNILLNEVLSNKGFGGKLKLEQEWIKISGVRRLNGQQNVFGLLQRRNLYSQIPMVIRSRQQWESLLPHRRHSHVTIGGCRWDIKRNFPEFGNWGLLLNWGFSRALNLNWGVEVLNFKYCCLVP